MEKRRERRSSRLSTAIVPPCSSIRHSVSCPPPYFTNQLWQPSPQTFRDFVHSFGSLPLNHPRLLSSQLSIETPFVKLDNLLSFFNAEEISREISSFFFFLLFRKIEERNTRRNNTCDYILSKIEEERNKVFSFSRFLLSRKRQPTTMLHIYMYIIHTHIKRGKIICLKDTKEGNVNSVRNVKASRNLQNIKRSKKRKKGRKKKKKKGIRANTVRICREKL